MRFFLGVVVGLLLGASGMYGYFAVWQPKPAPAAAALPADAGVPEAKKKAKGGKRGRGGGSASGEEGVFDEPVPELSAADLEPMGAGDRLEPRARSLDLGQDGPEPRDLSSGEIDEGFRPAAGGVSDCITQARGNAPVTGTVQVGLVVDPQGKVARSRVEAPAYLVKHGLYKCVKSRVASLQFLAPGRDVVVTIPFQVE